MPIFEYVCRSCQKRFEAIVFPSTKPECPSCQSKELDKQLSVFAVNGKAEASAPPAGECGGCCNAGGGGCRFD